MFDNINETLMKYVTQGYLLNNLSGCIPAPVEVFTVTTLVIPSFPGCTWITLPLRPFKGEHPTGKKPNYRIRLLIAACRKPKHNLLIEKLICSNNNMVCSLALPQPQLNPQFLIPLLHVFSNHTRFDPTSPISNCKLNLHELRIRAPGRALVIPDLGQYICNVVRVSIGYLKAGPGNLSIRIKHIVIGPGVTAVVTAPKSRSSAGWFILQFDIEETGSKLVKVVLKKTCLSGVKNCGISCGSGTDIVLKHNC
ncbi:hypothetical protein NQ317_002684 [Molorchus minor]|uniref:Uncharacterized protein n=1 Tax=Molorchus minor TaxID=1323400 RepID=A0ABQ9JX63_9CUCU|nr:hypothetical protein NQ317_002684 [Molorchus minor]